jgi:hypothetical protein
MTKGCKAAREASTKSAQPNDSDLFFNFPIE